MDNSVSHRYVKVGEYYKRMRNKKKHPVKLHVWGGISSRGKTALVMFPGNERMNSLGYQKIIKKAFVPYNNEKHNGRYIYIFSEQFIIGRAILCHDNAPSHKSRSTEKKLDEMGVVREDWPPESPDLNPIELVWGYMKDYIRYI